MRHRLLLFVFLRLFGDGVPVLSAKQFVVVDLSKALFLGDYIHTDKDIGWMMSDFIKTALDVAVVHWDIFAVSKLWHGTDVDNSNGRITTSASARSICRHMALSTPITRPSLGLSIGLMRRNHGIDYGSVPVHAWSFREPGSAPSATDHFVWLSHVHGTVFLPASQH